MSFIYQWEINKQVDMDFKFLQMNIYKHTTIIKFKLRCISITQCYKIILSPKLCTYATLQCNHLLSSVTKKHFGDHFGYIVFMKIM
jgi:hypothetical protein